MDREKLGVVLRRIWTQKDSKMDGWNDVADYILDNFVAKEDVERDYERRENWDCGLTFSKSISKKLGVFHDWDAIDAEISRLKEIERQHRYLNECLGEKFERSISEYERLKEIEKKWDMQEICKEAMTKGIAFSKVDAIKQEPQTKVYAIASDFERLKELEKSGKPQDSKPRECDNKPDANQAVSVTPPSIYQHEWVEQISPDRPNYFICKHCGKDKPDLPDVPRKIEMSKDLRAAFSDIQPSKILFSDKIDALIDCYSALKKVVERRDVV